MRFLEALKARLRRSPCSTAVDFPARSFDAVTAFYSIGHVPKQLHATLFARISTWLRPSGLFLAALACGNTDGVVGK